MNPSLLTIAADRVKPSTLIFALGYLLDQAAVTIEDVARRLDRSGL